MFIMQIWHCKKKLFPNFVDNKPPDFPNTARSCFRVRGGPFLHAVFSNLHKMQIWVAGWVEKCRLCKLHLFLANFGKLHP